MINDVNYIPQQTTKILLTEIGIYISSWNKLLNFVGGAKKKRTRAWYLIKWDVDSKDSSSTESAQEDLNIIMNDEKIEIDTTTNKRPNYIPRSHITNQ